MGNICNTNKVRELNELVKSCITQAFLQLLETKEFSKISVTEITEKAGVARVSFYRNFDSKEDILAKHIEKIFFDVDFTNLDFYQKYELKQLCLRSFGHTLENKEFFKAMHRDGLLYLLYDRLKIHTPTRLTDGIGYTQEILPRFFAGATYGVICHWIETDFSSPLEKFCRDFIDMLYFKFPD